MTHHRCLRKKCVLVFPVHSVAGIVRNRETGKERPDKEGGERCMLPCLGILENDYENAFLAFSSLAFFPVTGNHWFSPQAQVGPSLSPVHAHGASE